MSKKRYVTDDLKKAIEFLWGKESLDKQQIEYLYDLLKFTALDGFDDTYRSPDERPISEIIRKAAESTHAKIGKISDSEIRGIETYKLKDIDYFLNLQDGQIIEIHNEVERILRHNK